MGRPESLFSRLCLFGIFLLVGLVEVKGTIAGQGLLKTDSRNVTSEKVNGTKGLGMDCPFGIYGPHPPKSCICLSTGVWRVSSEYCTAPLALFGVPLATNFCFINSQTVSIGMLEKVLGLEVPEVAQLSTSMHKLIDRFDATTSSVPFPEDVYDGPSTLVSYGHEKWTLKTAAEESYCLIHRADPRTHFCIFSDLRADNTSLRIRGLSPDCLSNLPIIQSSRCIPLRANSSCEQETSLQDISFSLNPASSLNQDEFSLNDKNLMKRDGSAGDVETTDTDGPVLGEDGVVGEGSEEVTLDATPGIDDDNGTSTSTNSSEETSENGHTTSQKDDDEDSLLTENEDDMSSGLEEIGHKLMRDQIDQYVDTVVAQMSGVSKDVLPTRDEEETKGGGQQGDVQGRYPVLKLLDLIKMIMQKTCSPVKAEYFDLALNSFVKVQLESFHVKEPFISHNAYRRISYALKRCYNQARPHAFHTASPKDIPKSCVPDALSEVTTDELDVYGNGSRIEKLEGSPASASSLLGPTATREPLTETVWKMLVNAHSYCYPYFKAYFNDHHTLTVALLPLFNNQVQDIWLKEGGYDTTKGRLYGGLLGDTRKVLEDVDNCVAASRYVSQYPWYMSRPMKDSANKWRRRRKRRATESGGGSVVANSLGRGNDTVSVGNRADEEFMAPQPVFLDSGNQLCMFDPDDPVAFLGKPVCT